MTHRRREFSDSLKPERTKSSAGFLNKPPDFSVPQFVYCNLLFFFFIYIYIYEFYPCKSIHGDLCIGYSRYKLEEARKAHKALVKDRIPKCSLGTDLYNVFLLS